MLAKDGHKVILEQIEDLNLVELVVNEEIVFQCDIEDLEFGKAIGGPAQRSATHEKSLCF